MGKVRACLLKHAVRVLDTLGAKLSLARHLVKLMPTQGRKFVDVFGRRMNILFRAIHEQLDFQHWVVNDITMAPFFRAVKEHGDKFQCTEKNKGEFDRLRELAKHGDPHALLMESFMTWGGSVYSSHGRTTFGGVSKAASYEAKVRLACQYMRDKDIKITQKDWRDCLEEEDLGANDFVVLDPPYAGVEDAGAYGCDSVSHLELVDYFKNAKHRWLLTRAINPCI